MHFFQVNPILVGFLFLLPLPSGGDDGVATTPAAASATLRPPTTCNGVEDPGECTHYVRVMCNSWTVLQAKCPALCQTCTFPPKHPSKNVLLLGFDDLRAQLGHQDRGGSQGNDLSYMQTPHLDAFAANDALVLMRAYVQVAICTASRTSILTGRRPDTTQAYELDNYWRNGRCSNCKTLPQHFLLSGYKHVVGMGKVFHPGKPSGYQDYRNSWTQKFGTGPPTTTTPPSQRLYRGEVSEVDDDDQGELRDEPISIESNPQDTNYASLALDHMAWLSKDAPQELGPWFIAVGLKGTHLPFNCPARFFALYNQSNLPIADNDYICSDDMQNPYPQLARRSYELQNYRNAFVAYETSANGTRTGREQRSEQFENEKWCNWRLSETRTRELTQGYLACVSYVDEQAGRIFKGLQANGFWNNTVVVVWSDHGYKLGEHHAWTKHTNFDVDLHVPFMIRVPGMPGNGRTSKATVELLDLFPTVVEAAGLTPVPSCPPDAAASASIDLCADGRSLMPLVQGNTVPPKAAASQFFRKYQSVMGYSIMTADAALRFGAWVTIDADGTAGWDRNKLTGPFGNLELYNHTNDPKEKRNLAGRTEERSNGNGNGSNHAALVSEAVLDELFALLQETFPQGSRTTTRTQTTATNTEPPFARTTTTAGSSAAPSTATRTATPVPPSTTSSVTSTKTSMQSTVPASSSSVTRTSGIASTTAAATSAKATIDQQLNIGAAGAAAVLLQEIADYSIGDRVEVLWEEELFNAEVIEVHPAGKVDVVYDIDGSIGMFLTEAEHRLRLVLDENILDENNPPASTTGSINIAPASLPGIEPAIIPAIIAASLPTAFDNSHSSHSSHKSLDLNDGGSGLLAGNDQQIDGHTSATSTLSVAAIVAIVGVVAAVVAAAAVGHRRFKARDEYQTVAGDYIEEPRPLFSPERAKTVPHFETPLYKQNKRNKPF